MLNDVPVLILANKQDLLNAYGPDELSQELGLNTLPRDRKWCILGCSAKTGDGLQDAMEWVVEQVNDKSESKA